MTTITKNMIIHRIHDSYNAISSLPYASYENCSSVFNEYMDFLIRSLCNWKAVQFKGYGKLVPRFKKGGRPVRNPKTGEALVMQDTYTVRLGSKANNSDGELERIVTSKQKSHVAFIVGVVRKADTINAEVMGDIVVNEFISALNESANTDHRIELRGFGVFSSKQVEQTFSRNPKTGEKVLTPARRQNHFKVSKTLRKRLKEARR